MSKTILNYGKTELSIIVTITLGDQNIFIVI